MYDILYSAPKIRLIDANEIANVMRNKINIYIYLFTYNFKPWDCGRGGPNLFVIYAHEQKSFSTF